MKSNSKRASNANLPDSEESPTDRVKQLIDQLHAGNRTAFARAIDVSHGAVFKLYAGMPAGKRLLCAVVDALGVNPDWLLHGRGAPFPSALPVADEPLAGPVHEASGQTAKTLDLGRFPGATQYWLRVGPGQVVANRPSLGVPVGTLLLMETDPARFPDSDGYYGELCVVKNPGVEARRGSPALVLAEVTTVNDDRGSHLTADAFDRGDDDGMRPVSYPLTVMPDGKVHLGEPQPLATSTFRGQTYLKPAADVPPDPPRIESADVLAVWTGLAYRPGRRLRG